MAPGAVTPTIAHQTVVPILVKDPVAELAYAIPGKERHAQPHEYGLPEQ